MNPLQYALLFVVILFSLGLLGAFIFYLAPVLAPFLLAAVFAYLADPIVEFFSKGKWKMPRTLVVILVFVLLLVILALVMFFLIPALQHQIQSLLTKLPIFITWLQTVLMPQLVAFGVDEKIFDIQTLKNVLTQHMSQASHAAKWMWQTVFHSGLALLEWLMHLLIVLVATFYLLRDWQQILKAAKSLLPQQYAATIIKIARQCDVVLATFVRGQLSVMVALGTFYSLGLTIVGVNFSLLLGMLAGFLSIVPYLGSIVGLGAALLVAYFQFHSALHIAGVLVVFGIGHVLEGMVLTPLLVGDKLGLHPVVVIFAVLAGGHLLGFVGVVIALPLTAILVVILRELLHKFPVINVAPNATQGGRRGK
ncbi:MAG: AI-2E family transporter [Proteobacteria bacterium]|nr:AI-2E family transporter [Pseudomonadota bacterium]